MKKLFGLVASLLLSVSTATFAATFTTESPKDGVTYSGSVNLVGSVEDNLGSIPYFDIMVDGSKVVRLSPGSVTTAALEWCWALDLPYCLSQLY